MQFYGSTTHLFSDIVHRFDDEFPDSIEFKSETLPSCIEKMRQYIDQMYNSNDDDIEDFYDLISCINDHTYKVLKNKNLSNEEKSNFCKNVRIYAKKQVKHKFRDWKYDKRTFWNSDEAGFQYFEGIVYIWKPSVNHYLEIANTIRQQTNNNAG
jgi:hypothetical protein